MSQRFLPVADLAEFEQRSAFIAAELRLSTWQTSPTTDFLGQKYIQVPPESSLYATALEKLPAAPGITSYLVRIVGNTAQTPMSVGPAELEALKYDSNACFIKGDYLSRMLGLGLVGVDVQAIQQFITDNNWQEPAAPIGWVLVLRYTGQIEVEDVYDLEQRYEVVKQQLRLNPKRELLYVTTEADMIRAYEVFSLLNQAGSNWQLQTLIDLIHRINPNWEPAL